MTSERPWDIVEFQLLKRSTIERLPLLHQQVSEDLIDHAWSIVARTERSRPEVRLSGVTASEYMDRLITSWDRRTRQKPNWSRTQWLYVSRRVPRQFYEMWGKARKRAALYTAGMHFSVHRLLDIQTALSPIVGTHPSQRGATMAFEIPESDIEDFASRLLQLDYLWLLQNSSRLIGKGADLILRPNSLPLTESSPELTRAVEVYDERITRITVTAIVGIDPWVETSGPSTRSILTVSFLPKPEDIEEIPPGPIAYADGRYTEPGEAFVFQSRYTVDLVDISPIAQITRKATVTGIKWWSTELPHLLALLHMYSHLYSQDDGTLAFQLRRVGYTGMMRGELLSKLRDFETSIKSLLDDLLPSLAVLGSWTPETCIRELMRIRGSIHPTTDGPVLRKTDWGPLYIDLASATRHLIWRLNIGRLGGGPVSNLRGTGFESAVQEIIDQTGFGPADNLRRLIHKQLKVNSDQVLTDIDAIADIPNVGILLIDAKSYPYTVEYGAGQYGAVTNMTTKVSADVMKWRQQCDVLRKNRRGRNYELPADRDLIGVIATPFPCYLPEPLVSAMAVPGLREASSIDEIEHYMRSLDLTEDH